MLHTETAVIVALITGSFSFATFLLTRFFTVKDSKNAVQKEKENSYKELEEKEKQIENQVQELNNMISKITEAYARQEKSLDVLKEATLSTLRNDIICLYNKYTSEEYGYMPIYERENLRHLTESYYGLGGNGVVPGLVEKLDALPTDKPNC